MMLTWLARGKGLTPHWGTEFFWITYGHLFDPLLHKFDSEKILQVNNEAWITNLE